MLKWRRFQKVLIVLVGEVCEVKVLDSEGEEGDVRGCVGPLKVWSPLIGWRWDRGRLFWYILTFFILGGREGRRKLRMTWHLDLFNLASSPGLPRLLIAATDFKSVAAIKSLRRLGDEANSALNKTHLQLLIFQQFDLCVGVTNNRFLLHHSENLLGLIGHSAAPLGL